MATITLAYYGSAYYYFRSFEQESVKQGGRHAHITFLKFTTKMFYNTCILEYENKCSATRIYTV